MKKDLSKIKQPTQNCVGFLMEAQKKYCEVYEIKKIKRYNNNEHVREKEGT